MSSEREWGDLAFERGKRVAAEDALVGLREENDKLRAQLCDVVEAFDAEIADPMNEWPFPRLSRAVAAAREGL